MMTPARKNERALLVTLALMGFSAFFAAMALITLLLFFIGEPSVRATLPSPDIVSSIATVESIDTLRKLCVSIARNLEIDLRASEAQSRFIDKVGGGLLAFLFVWGSLSAVGLLYVYAQLRRVEKE